MRVTPAELESRMERLPDDALNAITCAPAQYTADAREAAAAVLRRRAAGTGSGSDSSADVPYQVSYTIDDVLLRPFRFLRTLRESVDRWQERTLPAGIPLRVRDLFWTGIASALPAVATICAAFNFAADSAEVVRELTSYSSVVALSIGASGLILSYGIVSERTYPRLLAIPFVALLTLWSLRPRRNEEKQSESVSYAGIAWSYQTISYLLKSSEAIDYYNQLRDRLRPRSLDEHAGLLPTVTRRTA